MSFKEDLSERTARAEKIITAYLPKPRGQQKTLLEAMSYSFLAGGKRLRPILMHETYTLFGGTSRIIEPFMAAIEMIHTYSLIHDDLPAMDDDMYRRGKYTNHVVYGEAMAILAGDGLLNLAYETALKSFKEEPELNENKIKALTILADRAGVFGMAGGQSVDVENDGKRLERASLDFIYDLKTGALIEGAMLTGAVLAGAAEDEQAVISRAAKSIGLAFQIQDDILDVEGTQEVTGKPSGSDEKNGKTTYVTFEGLKKSKEDVKALTDEALLLMGSLHEKNDFLNELLRSLAVREK